MQERERMKEGEKRWREGGKEEWREGKMERERAGKKRGREEGGEGRVCLPLSHLHVPREV